MAYKLLTYHLKCEMEYKYGTLFREVLESSDKWRNCDDIPAGYYVILSDKNSISLFQSYLEGEIHIALKHSLAKTLSKKSYIPYTMSIIHGKVYRPDTSSANDCVRSIWFLKPSNRFVGEGKDIKLLKSMDEFDINDPHLKKYTHWVLQEEVYPPMLFNSHKFVIRFFSFHVYTPNILFVYSGSKCRFNIYAQEYKDVNDVAELSQISHNNLNLTSGVMTRVGSVEGLHTLSGEYVEDSKHLMNDIAIPQILEIIHDITELMVDKYYDSMGCYGYSIHGYDFMLREDGKVFLIEVNEHPYLNFEPESLKQEISIPMFHDFVDAFCCLVKGKEPKPKTLNFVGKYKIPVRKVATPLEGKKLCI